MKEYKINNKVISLADETEYISSNNRELLLGLSVRKTLEQLLELLK